MVVWSCVAHLGGLGLVLVAPGDSSLAPPAVIDVELLGAPTPPAPAPKPAAEPVEALPAPPPPPPPPKPDAVVLPEKPREPVKPKPKPKPREPEVFREPEKKVEKSLDELMAEMRGESAEPAPEAPREPVETASVARSGGPGTPISAEEAAWHRQVRQHMKGRWILPAGFRTQRLQTVVSVRLGPGGQILGEPEIVRRSGNPWYDDSVLRGLAKASPLPQPPDAGSWQLVFRPEDSL